MVGVQRHLYLDIDSVLNTHDVGPAMEFWGDHEEPSILISYAPRLIRAVNHLIASTEDLQVFWLTSWEEEAAWFGEQVGLVGAGDWEWLSAVGGGRGLEWEKFVSLRDHLEQTQPDQAVWCDDELATEPAAREWARDRGVLTIAPDNVLLPQHLVEVTDFLTN